MSETAVRPASVEGGVYILSVTTADCAESHEY